MKYNSLSKMKARSENFLNKRLHFILEATICFSDCFGMTLFGIFDGKFLGYCPMYFTGCNTVFGSHEMD